MRATRELNDWLHELVEAARAGEILSVSAGGGPERDYAYMHFRRSDGEHRVVVFRLLAEDGHPTVSTFSLEGDDPQIARAVEHAAHPEP